MVKESQKQREKTYIYVNESGDLGFGQGGSKYFAIAFFETKSPIEVKRVVRRVKKKYKIPREVEMKANTTKRKIKIDLLRKLSKLSIEIQSITVRKENVDLKLRQDTNILYNYMVGLSLGERIVRSEPRNAELIIVVDKRIISVTSGFKFNEYLKYKIWYEKERKDIDLQIWHLDSCKVYGLEAIDNIVNAIFKKYNSADTELFNIIKRKITYDKTLFFNK